MEQRNHDPLNTGASGILVPGSHLIIRALLWALLLFVLGFGSLYASVFGDQWFHLRGNAAYLPSIFVPIGACLGYELLVHRFERRKASELHISLKLVPDLALGFVLGGIFLAAMSLLLLAFNLYSVHRGVWTRWFDDLLFDSHISAVVEELTFRAVLLRIFARLWGVRNAVIFGLVHITHHSWLGVLGIAINGGITMGLLYVNIGRLWMSIGMHLGYDFIETSVLGVGSHQGFLVSEPSKAAAKWLTGGSFGPDAAIPAMILGVLINVVLWRYAFAPQSTASKRAPQEASIASLAG